MKRQPMTSHHETSRMSTNGHIHPPSNLTNTVNVNPNERIISLLAGLFVFSNGLSNLFKKPIGGITKVAVGGYLMYRGASGNCPMRTYLGKNTYEEEFTPIELRTTLTVNKPKEEVYRFWRKLENLPLFMKHLKQVQELDQHRSHWEAKVPGNLATIKWNAEILEDEPNSRIAWQSIAGSMVENAGEVEFRDSIDGLGTEIRVLISYRPPAGSLGTGLASVLNPLFEKMLRDDINNFKNYIEVAELGALTKNKYPSNIGNMES